MNKPRIFLGSSGKQAKLLQAGILYFWKGERPRHPNAPQLEGTSRRWTAGARRSGPS